MANIAVDGRPFYYEAVDVLQRVFGYAEFRTGQFGHCESLEITFLICGRV